MKEIFRANDRAKFDFGWLKTAHSFSFGEYHDPDRMGFRCLRVINEDFIAGGAGFSTHRHRDMEIFTYVVEGALEHKDSLGNSAVIKPGDLQKMTAGTGVEHSEFNHFKDRSTHLFQIWILPDSLGLEPSYQQKSFEEQLKKEPLVLVASKEGRQGSFILHQNADILVGKFSPGEERIYSIESGRYLWIQMLKGELLVDAENLSSSDACAVSGETDVQLRASSRAEFLLFDLP